MKLIYRHIKSRKGSTMAQQPSVQYALRLPPDLRAWLADRAKENSRSVNGEIISILKDAQGGKDQDKPASKSSK
jgi:hypothetical protein